ncbi:MAG: PKD domain-containing protein, partial [Bacteroidetes bacterium]|nr:PKD domain-containing protein [Bacteroidota bacterium]
NSLYYNSSYFVSCNTASNGAAPIVGSVPGFSPPDSLLPCLSAGGRHSDTIYFKNFTTFSIATVNSLKFDSIYLPAGLCWSTNKANNTFAGGEDGVIIISGTPTVAPGSYKLKIIVDLNTSIGAFAAVDLEPLAFMRYHARIGCINGNCPTIDQADTISVFASDTSSCNAVLSASITASRSTTLCSGDSVTLTANYGLGYSYLWSTGATTRSIIVASAGSYAVTVSYNGSSATSSPVQVTVSTSCPVDATISPAGPINICPGTSGTLTAPSHANYTYLWSNGQTTRSITVTTAATYSVTVSDGVNTATSAVSVTSNNCGTGNGYWDASLFGTCNAATNNVTPHVSTVPGLSPPDSLLPCMSASGRHSDTIYFKNYTTFSVATVNSLKIDSIFLPAGLCWSTNKANNTFTTGEDGVILVEGIPTTPAGVYKLRIVADVNTSIGTFTAVDLEQLIHMRYHIGIGCSNGACPVFDQSDTVNIYAADTSACGTLVATISANGSTTLCSGDSVTLTANYGAGYTYAWSTGATTRSITVGVAGSYTVTVSNGGNTATSSPVQVTLTSSCVASAAISPSGTVNICSGSSQVLSAPSHAGYLYAWSTGQTTQSITVTTAGTYSVTVTYGSSTASDAVTVTSNNCGNIDYSNLSYFINCNAATNGIAPQVAAVPGLAPMDTALPCLQRGTAGSDTIYFKNFTTFSVATVNSIKFDSIYLPAGLCWSTNKANNTFTTGEDGVILISGTPTAPAGSYKLRIVADVNTSIGNFVAMDLEALAGLRYHVRISCPSYACTTINPSDSVSLYVPDNSSCSNSSLTASITASGPTTFCDGGSVILTANYDTAYSYHWSNGYTSSNTVVYASGTYTVTVTQNGNSVVATPVTVTVNPLPTAAFSLVQNPGTAHSWTIVNQCVGPNLFYHWTWGDNSGIDSLGATPTHTYDSAGYYTICVAVTDQNGCQSSYCDSNAYLYKTEGQMISVSVVQYALGLPDVNGKQLTMSYYAGAVHFSDNITDPSDVTLYDMSGRIVMSRKGWTGSVLTTDDALADGVYIVSLQNSARRLSGRIGIVR